MSSYHSIVFLTKLISAASIITLAVGYFCMPSDEEKIQKMKKRLEEKEMKYDKGLSEESRTLKQQISRQHKNVEHNKKKENLNVFSDL